MLLVCLLAVSVLPGADKASQRLYKKAQVAERAGDTVRAYLLYSEAAAKDPSNQLAWVRAQALRPASARARVVTVEPPPAPVQVGAAISDRDLFETRQPLPPPELKAKPGLQEFDLRGDSKQLFEQVAHTFGLEPIFDSGYQPKNGLRFQVAGADYHEAIRALEAATESFVIPVTSKQFLVANETTAKRGELDRVAAIVIPVPEPFTIQEVQEIATAVRGTLDIQRMMVDSQRRLILVRDRVSKVRMAQKLIGDLMQPKPVVAVEVELITTDMTSSLTYGLSLPSALPLAWFGKAGRLYATTPSGYSNFLGFGGGKSSIGLGVTDSSLFLTASKSNSRTLLLSEVVTNDGQAATLHVGDKYPIQSQGYYGGASTGTGSGGQVYAPPPTFTFEDLGLILKITPRVHGLDDVTLEVEAEFKLLGSQAVDNIPIISNRKFQSKVRIGAGEWGILAGLMTDSDGVTASGIPGLSIVPALRKNTRNHSHGETLVVLKPHILSMPPTEAVMKPAWVGTETRPRSAL